jgi:hypothetical protein
VVSANIIALCKCYIKSFAAPTGRARSRRARSASKAEPRPSADWIRVYNKVVDHDGIIIRRSVVSWDVVVLIAVTLVWLVFVIMNPGGG